MEPVKRCVHLNKTVNWLWVYVCSNEQWAPAAKCIAAAPKALQAFPPLVIYKLDTARLVLNGRGRWLAYRRSGPGGFSTRHVRLSVE